MAGSYKGIPAFVTQEAGALSFGFAPVNSELTPTTATDDFKHQLKSLLRNFTQPMKCNAKTYVALEAIKLLEEDALMAVR